MHIEPGVVDGAKIVLSYATALAALGLSAKASIDMIKKDGLVSLISRSVLTTLFVFAFFIAAFFNHIVVFFLRRVVSLLF